MTRSREYLKQRGVRDDTPADTDTQGLIREVLAEFAEFLVAKNRQYGDSAIRPRRVLSRATPETQLLVRMDDKINRMEQGDNSQETVEEAVKDLLGYWVLLQVVRRLNDAADD